MRKQTVAPLAIDGLRSRGDAETDCDEEHPMLRRPSRRGGMNGLRELTVTTLHRVSARPGEGEEAVPYLRLSGRWLEQYGLARGCRVVVSGEPGRLVLTVAEPPGCS